MHIVNDKILENLKKSGFSDKEAKIYTTLLEMGGAYPSRIAEVSQLNRSTVYKILTELSIKGLISEVEKGKKLFYQVERPQRLIAYAKRRSVVADEQLENVTKLIPDLEGIFSVNPNKPVIRYFEDKEGMKLILQDHISQDKPYEMLGFANTTRLEDFLGLPFLKNYVAVKEKKKITTRGIVPNAQSDFDYTPRLYANIDKKYWLKLRHIPKEQFPFNGEITIYGEDKVSIVNFNDDKMVGIIIQDKAIHEMMVRIFELAWIGAKQVETMA